ncbi:MAG: DUF1152 domain-containing protein [Thermoanaerobaculia bacterium]|nr:DUF1152 domain-containing protein [Thermoanaerobaculia bacterium]
MLTSQPFNQALANAKSILLAGAGGGYDVLGAIPLYCELRAAGKQAHLASLSFTALRELAGARPVAELPHLYEITGAAASASVYCPEAWLARWLSERFEAPTPVWCFEKTGVVPLASCYAALVEQLGIDTIVLVDGGVDLILRGDESSLGTPAEDLCSLAAVSLLPRITSLVACVGFGAEMRDDIPHAQVLERIADLSSKQHFLGTAALIRGMVSAEAYENALAYVFSNQQQVKRSHVHTVVSKAVCGVFGYQGPDTWISPLSAIYWFFSLPGVARAHLFLDHLLETRSMFEVTSMIEGIRKTMRVREATVVPL